MQNIIVEDRRDDYGNGMSSLQYLEDARCMFGGGEELFQVSEHCNAVLTGQNMARGMRAFPLSVRHNKIRYIDEHLS